MTLTLIGTCYSHNWDGRQAHRAIIGVGDAQGGGDWRLSKRSLPTEAEAMWYGKRLFYRLARMGAWEIVDQKQPELSGG